jgi:hypothetical protein
MILDTVLDFEGRRLSSEQQGQERRLMIWSFPFLSFSLSWNEGRTDVDEKWISMALTSRICILKRWV